MSLASVADGVAVGVIDLGGHMASAVEGIDLSRPVSPETIAWLRGILLDRLVLCIRGQELAPQQYVAAMRNFGTVMRQIRAPARHPEAEEIQMVTSEDRDEYGDGKRVVVGELWHTDDSFKAVPCALTTLYGVVVPPVGGDTQFANMYAAYEALPAETRHRLEGMRIIHRWNSTRPGVKVATLSAELAAKLPEVAHPIVRTHPDTGRRALYLNPNRMERVVGLETAESGALLDELSAHATEPRFLYRHKWRRGDIVIWDNRCTMHKANADYAPTERREMHRTITEGTVPV